MSSAPNSTSPAMPAPRLVTAAEAARLLGRSRSWFYAHRRRLYALGFPRPHPAIGLYDRELILAFVDKSADATQGDGLDLDELFEI